MVTQIATAATQQSAATKQIDNNIEEIARIASSTVAGAQQTSVALQDLSGLALNLRQLVGQFQLSSNKSTGNDCSRADTSQLYQQQLGLRSRQDVTPELMAQAASLPGRR